MQYSSLNHNKVCLVGILGSGMSKLALFLRALDIEVIGIDRSLRAEDMREADLVVQFEQADIAVHLGWDVDAIVDDADLYVYSSGIVKTNPVILYVQKNFPQKSKEYGVFLSSIMQDYYAGKGKAREWLAGQLQSFGMASLLDVDFSKACFVGVTGTKGKTSTITMLHDALCSQGRKVGMITTNGAVIDGREVDTGFHVTTPAADVVKGLIEHMYQANVAYILIEVTSHALVQQRLAGALFDLVIFTNIAHEHLDYHTTWENYADAKALLMHMVKPGGRIIINSDDTLSYHYLVKKARTQNRSDYVRLIGKDGLTATHVHAAFGETKFDADGTTYTLPITGEFNVANALACIEALRYFGFDDAAIQQGVASYVKPQGRMDIVQTSPFTVVIDFAHTPDSLLALLRSLRALLPAGRKLTVVFGCAGLRDDTKRQPMGEIAVEWADRVVIVPEDPRTESLTAINAQILEGIEKVSKIVATKTLGDITAHVHTLDNAKTVAIFSNESVAGREEGIQYALSSASEGDIVVLAGKGHEQSMCFGVTEHSWDETRVANDALTKIAEEVTI